MDDPTSSKPNDDRKPTFFQKIRNLFRYDEKLLREPDMDSMLEYIIEGRCRNIITMAGAGISTSAGIPDFRSPGSGLYDNLQQYNLRFPELIFFYSYFRHNPEPFFTLAKNLFPSKLQPTPSHYFIKLLEEKGFLLRHYTQNIDTLERVAGVSDNKLKEAHGTFSTGHCLRCKSEYGLKWLRESILKDTVPKCSKCQGVVKPDVVLFGESLPASFSKDLSSDVKRCDLLIILGTSLQVQPFASIANKVKSNVPRLYINLQDPPCSTGLIGGLLGYDVKFKSGQNGNTRDVFWRGKSDQACFMMADKLGWMKDFQSIIKNGKPLMLE